MRRFSRSWRRRRGPGGHSTFDRRCSIECWLRPVWREEKNALRTREIGVNRAVETCLDEDVMLALLARRSTNLADVQMHLERCAECRAVFAELVKSSRPPVPRARA